MHSGNEECLARRLNQRHCLHQPILSFCALYDTALYDRPHYSTDFFVQDMTLKCIEAVVFPRKTDFFSHLSSYMYVGLSFFCLQVSGSELSDADAQAHLAATDLMEKKHFSPAGYGVELELMPWSVPLFLGSKLQLL